MMDCGRYDRRRGKGTFNKTLKRKTIGNEKKRVGNGEIRTDVESVVPCIYISR